MRIVIDGRIIRSTTGRYVERLLTYLQKIDAKNEYIVLLQSKDQDYWKPSSSNFSTEVCDIASFSLAEQTKLLRQLRGLHADLVHFCMPQQPVLYRGKKVTTIHDLSQFRVYNPSKNWLVYRLKQFVGWFVFKHVIRTSAHIVTDSNYSRDDIIRFSKHAAHKITTVYLSADKLTAISEPYPVPSKQYILYVGQQSEYKNTRRLILAHQKLLDSHPELYLVMVGSLNDAAQRVQQWSTEHKHKNVLFTGFVPDEQLAWLYEHALVYGFSSLMEGFGLPGIEAMRHGTPLASSNATCSPEVFGDAAEYFDPKNVDDMAEKLANVIDSAERRQELVEHGYRQAEKYSWEKMAQETYDIYMTVLGKN